MNFLILKTLVYALSVTTAAVTCTLQQGRGDGGEGYTPSSGVYTTLE